MSESVWSLEYRADLRVVRCAALDVKGVGHAFTTAEDRQGRIFDVGSYGAVGDASWRERVLGAAQLSGRSLLDPRQSHGTGVLRAAEAESGAEADGVVAFAADAAGRAPAVRTADCVPLLLVARDGSALAAIHAGWRGTAAGIVERAIETMSRRGVPPAGLIAAMGPAIGICCFQVGDEVVDAMVDRFGSLAEDCAVTGAEGTRLGLVRLIRRHLIELGLEPAAVHCAPWCTRCADIPLYSYRRQGAQAGRQLACVGWITA